MEQAIINVEGTTTIETAAAAKKMVGNAAKLRLISFKLVSE